MKVKAKAGHWFAAFSLGLILTAMPCLAQNRRAQNPPAHSQPSRPAPQPHYQQAPPQRNQPAPQPHYQQAPQPRNQAAPQQRYEVPRPQASPQGHHSGQWLEQHRQLPLDQQRRALQNDPSFRRLSPQRQQQLEQRLQHFDSLPPDRQQRVLQHMETWEHLTSSQKQEFRSMDSQFHSLPPDRQQAVRNAIQSMRAMPPAARERAIQEGRFEQFSPQERQILNNAARLPLAPAQSNAAQPQAPSSGPQRYIPRPPP